MIEIQNHMKSQRLDRYSADPSVSSLRLMSRSAPTAPDSQAHPKGLVVMQPLTRGYIQARGTAMIEAKNPRN